MNIINKNIFHTILTIQQCFFQPLVLTLRYFFETKKLRVSGRYNIQQFFFQPLVLSVLRSFSAVECIEGCNIKKTLLFYLSFVASFDTFLKTKIFRTSGGVEFDKIFRTSGLKFTVFFLGLLTPLTTCTIPPLETGIEYQKKELFTDAITCYEEIIVYEPRNANAWFNLGNCYLALGFGEKALTAFNTISHALSAQYNAAYTHKTIGNLDKAIEGYTAIINNNPDYEPAHLALGIAYITRGDFECGWKQHERHLKRNGKNADALRALLKNNNLTDKNILLRPEGGLGDTLLFIRYAERLKNMGAHITVACPQQLIPLLSRCAYIDTLLSCDSPTPYYDADATLMSLPAIFNDTDQSAPKKIPYLYADPTLVAHWQQQLANDTNFKIGICWQVDVHNDASRIPIARRGCPLKYFTILNTIPGVSFYSLQKYDGTEEISTMPTDFQLHTFDNLDETTGPFMDTAALMKNLDLIITVDTAIVHLAGGLGCPVWLLHPYATADWRWLAHRTDSYWYPTVRIFKQQQPFAWDEVMKKVKIELHTLMCQK